MELVIVDLFKRLIETVRLNSNLKLIYLKREFVGSLSSFINKRVFQTKEVFFGKISSKFSGEKVFRSNFSISSNVKNLIGILFPKKLKEYSAFWILNQFFKISFSFLLIQSKFYNFLLSFEAVSQCTN